MSLYSRSPCEMGSHGGKLSRFRDPVMLTALYLGREG